MIKTWKNTSCPDIDMGKSSDCKAKRVDERLKRACDEMLKQLDAKK